MSNTSNGKAVKGSKMQMQRITEKENQQILNKLFDDELKWLSPCRKDNYREYQLNNPGIKKLLGIKYPGAENKPTGRSRKTISLPWPENLLRELEASAVKAAIKRREQLPLPITVLV